MDFDYALVTDWPKHKPRQRYLPWINIGIRKIGKDKTNTIGLHIGSGNEAPHRDKI